MSSPPGSWGSAKQNQTRGSRLRGDVSNGWLPFGSVKPSDRGPLRTAKTKRAEQYMTSRKPRPLRFALPYRELWEHSLDTDFQSAGPLLFWIKCCSGVVHRSTEPGASFSGLSSVGVCTLFLKKYGALPSGGTDISLAHP